jgi:hypothetical protein
MPWYKNADDDVEKILARAKGFGSVGVKVVFRSATDGRLSEYISKEDCVTREQFIQLKKELCEEIKRVVESLKTSEDKDLVNLFDSLVIKKSDIVSINLNTTVI